MVMLREYESVWLGYYLNSAVREIVQLHAQCKWDYKWLVQQLVHPVRYYLEHESHCDTNDHTATLGWVLLEYAIPSHNNR